MNKSVKIIRKWAKLRHPDKKFADTAIAFYHHSNEKDRVLMIKEYSDYINAVDSGIIEASPVELKIPKFK